MHDLKRYRIQRPIPRRKFSRLPDYRQDGVAAGGNWSASGHHVAKTLSGGYHARPAGIFVGPIVCRASGLVMPMVVIETEDWSGFAGCCMIVFWAVLGAVHFLGDLVKESMQA
ncbi:MAG: hypothetical protein P1U65_18015 [Minwuia sp.]|nr:hypothetical protein [Minwuia sp.]